MKLLDRFKRNKGGNADPLQNEQFVIEAHWGEQPDAQIIDAVSQEVIARGLPDIKQTNPRFSLAQFEILVKRIFDDRVAAQANLGDFKIPSLILYRRFNDGSDGEDNLEIKDMIISMDPRYENLTKVFVEAIFNNPRYLEIEYDDKLEFASALIDAYMDQMGVGVDDVVSIPTSYDVEAATQKHVPIELHVPSLVPQKFGEPVEDNTKGISVSSEDNNSTKEDGSFGVGDVPGGGQGETETSLPNPPSVSTPPAISTKRSATHLQDSYDLTEDQVQVGDGEQSITSAMISNYPIEFPMFDTLPLEVKDPEESGYVEYMLNQDKLHFNQEFARRQQVYRDQFKAKLADIQQQNTMQTNDDLSDFIKTADHRDDIHGQVVQKFKIVRDTELKKETAQIDQERNSAAAEEDQRHKNRMNEIDRDRDQKLNQLTAELNQRHEELVDQEEHIRLAEATRDLINQREEFINTMQEAQKVDVERFAADNVAKFNDYGTDLINKARQVLEQNAIKYTNSHSNALQAKAAADRADAENKKVNQDFEKGRRLETELNEARNQIASLQTENGNLKGEITSSKGKSDSENLNTILTTLALNNQQPNSNSNNNSESLGLMKAIIEGQNQKNQNNDPNKSNWLVAGVVTMIVLVVGGFGMLFANNQNNRVNQIQAQATQMSSALKDAKKSNADLNDQLKSETDKRSAAESAASDAESKQKELEQSAKDAQAKADKAKKTAATGTTTVTPQNVNYTVEGSNY